MVSGHDGWCLQRNMTDLAWVLPLFATVQFNSPGVVLLFTVVRLQPAFLCGVDTLFLSVNENLCMWIQFYHHRVPSDCNFVRNLAWYARFGSSVFDHNLHFMQFSSIIAILLSLTLHFRFNFRQRRGGRSTRTSIFVRQRQRPLIFRPRERAA